MTCCLRYDRMMTLKKSEGVNFSLYNKVHMAIGVLNPKEFEEELNRLKDSTDENPVSRGVVIPSHDKGRGLGNNQVPNSIRKIISEDVLNGIPASEVSEAFGISKSSISAYKNGSTSTSSYDKPNDSLTNFNRTIKDKLLKKSRKAMLRALDHMTEDKFEGARLTELSIVAKNMSGIAADMEPVINNQINNTQVIVYRPRMKEEDDYVSLQLNE